MSTIAVEADVYSGRPNPMWQLSSEEAQEFTARLEKLPPLIATHAPTTAAHLGYRGMKVEFPSKAAFQHLTVGGGTVTAEGDKAQIWSDPQSGLEKWLLRTGRRSLGDELFQYLIQQIP